MSSCQFSEMKIVGKINVKTLLNILKVSIVLVAFFSLYLLVTVTPSHEPAELLEIEVLAELEARQSKLRFVVNN